MKLILILLDGLNYRTARTCMGYLNGLLELQKAALYRLRCELPAISRPLYECLLTGVRPIESGILHNNVVRLSHSESIFSLARTQGLCTAAAAYHWVSELYNRAPFRPLEDRFVDDKELNIQHGCFYFWDHYPDEALFLDAEYLRRRYRPDFLFIHPMNIDDAGHKAGNDSMEYRNAARIADVLLSSFLPQWLDEGYQVMVTSDHGMTGDRVHGGTLVEEREVPLFVAGSAFSHREMEPFTVQQTDICGTMCSLLGLKHSKSYAKELLC